eukprot:gene7632-11954_t
MKKFFAGIGLGSMEADDDAIIKKEKVQPVPEGKVQLEKPEAKIQKSLIDVENMKNYKPPVQEKDENRYSTFLSTDKPIYKKGETVYCRAVVLNSFTNVPVDTETSKYLSCGVTVKVLGPGGDEIISTKPQSPQQSVFSFCWTVSEDAAGGNYTCKIEYELKGFPSAERKFEVRAFQNPRLNSDLEFLKKGYGSGEEAVATLKVSRAEGGKPSGAKVTATSRIDGKETWTGKFKLDEEGNCLIKFKLPDSIAVGDGTLSCVIEDGGVLETKSKTIPILLQSLDVNVYPEGGDLINDVECGVYIEAFTPYGDPADLKGDIVDKDGNVVGSIETKHEGRGKGKFTPKKENSYSLKINSPSGIKHNIQFPPAKSEGASVMSTNDVYSSNKIDVKVGATKGEYIVYIYKRDILLDSKKVKVQNSNETVSVDLDSSKSNGVLRVLVTNSKNKPLSERLVFQSAKETIDVKIKTDYKSYSPGDKATVKVSTTSSDGKPVDAVVCVTVTDESVLKSVEERKRAPRLQQMVFLENEVDHFEDAHVYLSDHENAEIAVDLLLGTQGWRRFAFYDVAKFLELKGEMGERIVAFHNGKDPKDHYDSQFPPVLQRGGWNDWDNDDELELCMNKNMVIDRCEMNQMMEVPKMENKIMPVQKNKAKAPIQKNRKIEKMAILQAKAKPQLEMAKMAFKPKEGKKKKAAAKKDFAPQFEKRAAKQLMFEDEFYSSDDEFPLEQKFDDSVITRVYAFKKNPNRKQGERTNFTETLYWSASTQTVSGEATIEFDFSDSVTSYRIMIDAFTNSGVFGAKDKVVESKEPFYVEAKLPVEATVGDTISVPVSVVNESPEDLTVSLDHDVSIALVPDKNSKFNDAFKVTSKERTKRYLDLTVDQPHTGAKFGINASAGVFNDQVTRKLDLVPLGFPFDVSFSGKLEKDEDFVFTIPKDADMNSIESNMKFYLKPVGQLQSALASLLRNPSGCFEQTSSTTYPTIIAHQYFVSHDGVDPALIKKSYGLLEKGYKKLTSYECKNGGYEWFGSEPANEALTAYGTLEFIDMSKVYPVDENMLNRTKKWLYSRRDGKGGFKLDSQALDDFGAAPKDITNAYIVWSLTEAGETGLDLEIDSIYKDALTKKDAYLWGLSAASLFTTKKEKEANELAKKIVANQEKTGEVLQSKTTITCSRGKALNIETTAIAVLTWLNDEKYNENIELAMNWLLKQCTNGKFGNTQSTILALKAIVKYDTRKGGNTENIKVSYSLDGKKFPVDFGKKNDDGFVEIDLDKKLLTPGDHTISLKITGKGSLPYSFFLRYFSNKPDSSDKCEIDLKNYLSSDKFEEGSVGEMNVEMKNLSNEKQAMTLAIISIPGGLEPRHENLQELVKGGKIAFYEIKGRDVIIYLRGMKENQELKFKFDVTARIPGKFKSSASRAYLYYVDEDVKWVEGTECTITSKK